MRTFKLLKLIAFYGLLSFLLTTCLGKERVAIPESPCGIVQHWYRVLNTSYVVATDDNGGMVSFYFEDTATPVNICGQEHVQATMQVETYDNKPTTDITYQAHAYWVVYGNKINMQWDAASNIYRAQMDIGLMQAFPDKPGWIGLQVIATFPDKGNTHNNKVYISSKVKAITIDFKYNIVK